MTVFNTRYKQFEYFVLFFELCNVSSTFQNYINEFFQKFLNHFVTTYFDDVLMYSDTKKKHEQQIFKIFRKFRNKSLHFDIDKCEFFVPKIKYLKIIVEKNDIEMNEEKIKTILKWKTSKSIKNVQLFLNFANFYKRFIVEFFKKMKCFTKLTKKKQYLTFNEKKNKISKISMNFRLSIRFWKFKKNIHKNFYIGALRFSVENVNRNQFVKLHDDWNVIANAQRCVEIRDLFFSKNEFGGM